MAEEFQESDIFFSDNNKKNYTNMVFIMHKQKQNQQLNARNNMPCSLPINISHNRQRVVFQEFTDSEDDFNDDEYEDHGGEIVPPHVIVARRVARQMAFSVCTGNGRTLKGRDLSRVRNSILKMTGFLEP